MLYCLQRNGKALMMSSSSSDSDLGAHQVTNNGSKKEDNLDSKLAITKLVSGWHGGVHDSAALFDFGTSIILTDSGLSIQAGGTGGDVYSCVEVCRRL